MEPGEESTSLASQGEDLRPTSDQRFGGGETAIASADSLVEHKQENGKPVVGSSGSTGVKSEILTTTSPDRVQVTPQTPSSQQGGSEERCPEQQRDPAAPTTPPTALPPELASQKSLTWAVEEQSQDPGKITLDTKVGSNAIEERLKRLEVDLQDHKQKNQEDQAAAKQSQERLRQELQEKIQATKQSLQQEVEMLKKDVERLTREREEFIQQLNTAKEELKQEQREKADLKTKLEETEKQLQETQKQLADKEKELRRQEQSMQTEREAMKLAQEQTQKILEESKQACRQLEADKEALKAEREDQSTLHYQHYEAMSEAYGILGASLGVLGQGDQAHPPPPPYDDRTAPAARSVEAEASVSTDGPGQAPRVQGPVFHGQPPVGNRLPNLTGAPESDQSSDDQEESPSNQTGNRRSHESDRENFFDGDLC